MRMIRRAVSLGVKLGCVGICITLCCAIRGGLAKAGPEPKNPDLVSLGYEIFNREWMPNDARGHGGDGLGPVYNDSSCVACHNSGGSGGAGPISKNIDILSAARSGMVPNAPQVDGKGPAVAPATSPSLDALALVHAGFRTSRNVVLHKFGTDPNYDAWRSHVLDPAATQGAPAIIDELVPKTTFEVGASTIVDPPPPVNFARAVLSSAVGRRIAARARKAEESGDARVATRMQQIRAMVAAANPALRSALRQAGEFLVARSQRNPTPLFGIGLIDAISDQAIEAMAKRQSKESPEIQGRVSRVKDGRIGRLGWKGQVASVEDFVLNACAVELGLEVPGHHQAMLPQAPKYRAIGLDLTSQECAALTAYVKSLPKPVERAASGAAESKIHEGGKVMFASIGCAGCHSPKLGSVQGIYSDLLLHDMGQDMQDDGSYSDSDSAGDDEPLVPRIVADAGNGKPVPSQPQPPRGATRREWRTPPLWGFRDSGPYLHDGRAQTLEQAVAMHGGQAAIAARKFFELSPRERLQIEALLKSLVAPPTGALASR